MSVVLTTVDHVPGGGTVTGPQLCFEVEQITARDIIRQRVLAEVARHNSGVESGDYLRGQIAQPREERALNGPRPLRPTPLDPERQVEVALAAAKARRIIILFNGEQVCDLDAPLLVTPVSQAQFLWIVPLVGG